MGSAGPQEDRIDGVVRRLGADVAQGGCNILSSRRVLDLVQQPERHPFRFLYSRANGCAETKLELARVNTGKNFSAQTRTEQKNNGRGDGRVEAQDQRAHSQDLLQSCRVALPYAIEFRTPLSFLTVRSITENPNRHDRNKRTRQEIRGHHGESHSQRQGYEQ